ncbi:hypothetical protein [Streptomyces sp. V3I7]|uniref:hypothetical protein n=1 Tax=Streptomyces sp. V3I7 TaxID=3042278 RepID=UPI002788FD52|nr:hypothetical protein [Streptomyces sp. V3I7]MDQ0992152.1 hypothetical protein [Streptomyces sp. V3I7]
MDAAVLAAIGSLIAGPVAAFAAMYGSRGATRAAQQSSAATMYDSLTQRLAAERDKAEADQAKAEARVEVLELENARLRLQVERLGGTP